MNRNSLHKLGHYVHYLEVVKRPRKPDKELEEREKRSDYYFNLPKSEKERFAHRYADDLRGMLVQKEVIPFDRIED